MDGGGGAASRGVARSRPAGITAPPHPPSSSSPSSLPSAGAPPCHVYEMTPRLRRLYLVSVFPRPLPPADHHGGATATGRLQPDGLLPDLEELLQVRQLVLDLGSRIVVRIARRRRSVRLPVVVS